MDWTIAKILQWTTGYFQEKSIESARLDAELLLSHVLESDRLHLYIDFDRPLNKSELVRFKELVVRRSKREPVAYMIGQKEFYSLPFYVDQHVLIPRPETEILVEWAIKLMKTSDSSNEPLNILDVGTGAGSIIVALGHSLRDSLLIGTDLSNSALQITRRNCGTHGISDRVQLICCDLLAPMRNSHRFDLIVSNPPYIPSAMIENLQPEIALYEPKSALDGGVDGLDYYRRMIESSPKLLKKNGLLLMEIGADQRDVVLDLLDEKQCFHDLDVKNDFAGLPRVVKARMKNI